MNSLADTLRFTKIPNLSEWLANEHAKVATFDRGFVILAIAMYMIGLVMVATSSMPVAERLFGNPFHFVLRHGIYIVLSIGIAAIALQIPMSWWQKNSGALLLLGMFLLLVVLLIGRSVNGSTRWIAIGPITIQAAEPAKLFFFCYLSAYLVRRRDEVMENLKGFIKPLVVFGLLAFFLLMQPDLGTVIVMFVTTFGLLFLQRIFCHYFLRKLKAFFGRRIKKFFCRLGELVFLHKRVCCKATRKP